MDVEITVWAVNAATPKAPPDELARTAPLGSVRATSRRRLFDAAVAQFHDAAVVARDALHPGQSVDGPAAITENETTVIVPASRRAFCHADGSLEVRVPEDGKP
jgi:N-methylhydantoinase A